MISRVHSTPTDNLSEKSAEQGVGRVILKDVLAISIAVAAIMAFYFFVKAFSILANIP